MEKFIVEDAWKVSVNHWSPKIHERCESIFSIGNGRFGQRANFEEQFSGKSLNGSYVAGVYYPDVTRVGWWKNGYPEYFAKVLNSVNWIGLNISLDGEELDLSNIAVEEFQWELNMKNGVIHRSFVAILDSGKRVRLEFKRFCSIYDDECAAIQLAITPLNAPVKILLESYLDADVSNYDANWDERFWLQRHSEANNQCCSVLAETKKTSFSIAVSAIIKTNKPSTLEPFSQEGFASHKLSYSLAENECWLIEKHIGLVSSLNYDKANLLDESKNAARRSLDLGFGKMLALQDTSWNAIWKWSDIEIDGDIAAQQAIRFNIFQLNQTYSGKDARLNIGPKGFTGEKYGGSTYWDTEAYCLPFYLNTKDAQVARQLLVYRYNHLEKAIENASKLGFVKGAALYPMVTMNGEECHNEWEITFEEIHRNGAIAYAIFNYVRHTDDHAYLAQYGWDVLLGIARFWAQRATWSEHKQHFVILGVTGPNEYENNVNNNWYTNYIASWCMRYAREVYHWMKEHHEEALQSKIEQYQFEANELDDWKEKSDKMYYQNLPGTKIKLQQDGFLDKEMKTVADLLPEDRPINQVWSWDRILRSVYIKQADVLQGLYFFSHEFDIETLKENFDYYEPRTVHESSLSPCVHAVLAAKLGMKEKSYEMYLRTARLDLDDYNNEVVDGLHITSMAGTWMSVVEGFGGMRVENGILHLQPKLPKSWQALKFIINFRGRRIKVISKSDKTQVQLLEGEPIELSVDEELMTCTA